MKTFLAILAALAPVIKAICAAVLDYYTRRRAREEALQNDLEKFDEALASGDFDALARLLTDLDLADPGR